MKTQIFYFTGTGNCLKVARDLGRELGDTEITSIPKMINQKSYIFSDCLGIIFPVYMFGLPLIIKDFVRKLKGQNIKYIFAIATYGGLAGDPLKLLSDQLKEQGLSLSAGFLVKMPGNYTPLYGALEQDKQDKLFQKEELRVKEIASVVLQKNITKIEKNSFLFNLIFTHLFYRPMSGKIPFMDRDFWVNDNCNGCGTCLKVCPVNNIELIDKKPRWLHKCQQCIACLQWCPKEAIEYGKNTPGRKRYHHPQIKLEDLL